MAGAHAVNERQFRHFCELAYARAGIHLKDGKEALVSARVAKRLRALDMTSIDEYIDYLGSETANDELLNFLDVISTNHTAFFREPIHFGFLAQAVRRWAKAGQSRFRIWCAAASSGEEPYTLAMTMAEVARTLEAPLDWRILGTDISTRVLRAAMAGRYSESRAERIPRLYRARYFRRLGGWGEEQPEYEVLPELRQRVLLKRLNLSTPPFPMQGPLDAVFCRNVMIYFDASVRQRLVSEVERVLKPGGYFIVGQAETIMGLETRLESVKPSIYRMPEVRP